LITRIPDSGTALLLKKTTKLTMLGRSKVAKQSHWKINTYHG